MPATPLATEADSSPVADNSAAQSEHPAHDHGQIGAVREKEGELRTAEPVVYIYVTGFGKFNGVPSNPTTVLVDNLENYLTDKNPLDHDSRKRVARLSCDVLETSAVGSLEILKQRFNEKTSGPGVRWVWLHFGVHGGAKTFLLEKQAFNNATFRCPDERGYTPDMLPICDEDGTVDILRHTTLPLTEICSRLQGRGHKVELSDDPGRFVCNWCYYNSLQLNQDQLDTESLFVHVPPFEVINEEQQLEFARDLIHELVQNACAQCANGAGSSLEEETQERRMAARRARKSGDVITDHLAGEWVSAV